MFGVVTYFIVSISHLKYTVKQAFALSDTFATVATGLVIATLVVHCVFVDSDKFFTKVARVQIKNFAVMCADWVLILVMLIYHLCRGETLIQEQKALQDRVMAMRPEPADSVADATTEARSRRKAPLCARLMRAQPLALLFATFFFTYQKLVYFPLLFWFT